MDLVGSGSSHSRYMPTNIWYWCDLSVYHTVIWCIFLRSGSSWVNSYTQYVRIEIESNQIGFSQVNSDTRYVRIRTKSMQLVSLILAHPSHHRLLHNGTCWEHLFEWIRIFSGCDNLWVEFLMVLTWGMLHPIITRMCCARCLIFSKLFLVIYISQWMKTHVNLFGRFRIHIPTYHPVCGRILLPYMWVLAAVDVPYPTGFCVTELYILH